MVCKKRNLYELAVAFRKGDAAAGWEFALSEQIQGCIRYWAGLFAKLSYTNEHDIEDLKADLTSRVVDMLGNENRLRMPEHERDDWNEGALVAWFRMAMQDMTRSSIKTIVHPKVGRPTETPQADVPFSQLVRVGNMRDGTGVDESHIFKDFQYDPDPLESLDKERRLKILALVQRHFASTEEARIAYEALVHYQTLQNWTKVALAVGYPKGKDWTVKKMALRLRNIIKAASIDFGEVVEYGVLAIYTSPVAGGVGIMQSNGVWVSRRLWTWKVKASGVKTAASFSRCIREVLSDYDVTFAVLNLCDRSSVMRTAALQTLHNREPVVELIDIRWLEAHACEQVGKLRRHKDPRRRALLLAHAKRAQCELHQEGVA